MPYNAAGQFINPGVNLALANSRRAGRNGMPGTSLGDPTTTGGIPNSPAPKPVPTAPAPDPVFPLPTPVPEPQPATDPGKVVPVPPPVPPPIAGLTATAASGGSEGVLTNAVGMLRGGIGQRNPPPSAGVAALQKLRVY